jgi:hypothetical protein
VRARRRRRCQSSNGSELTFANNRFPTIGNSGFALWFGGALPGSQCWIFMAAALTVAAQGLVFDPGAPSGIVLSKALLIIVGA